MCEARPRRIRDAVENVLRHGAYRERALDLGVRIRADARESKAVPVLESIAERSTGAHRAEPNQAPTAAFPASIER